MAKPEVEDAVFFVWIGEVHAIQTYIQLISSKPETNFDGKNNVLLSTQPTVPDIAKEGDLELGEVEDGIHDGECPPNISITIKCPDQRVLIVVRVSRALTFAKSSQQRRHYLKSFCSCLREQLRHDEHLSKTIVTVCSGDETTNDETIEDDLKSLRNPIFPTQNIGQGLAFLYFFDQLFPVLHGMEDRVGRLSHLKLLPAVVIDCSNDVATANDEQFKAFGWLSIAIDPIGKRQRLISNQVFQLGHDTVIVERPPPIWTLKTLRKIEKLSQEEYESEFLAFRKTLQDLIAAKIFGGQIKECHCSIYDGNGTNLADHIWSSGEKGNIAHRKPTRNVVDLESDESDDGVETDCEEDSPSRDSDDYNSKLESDSVAVPKSRGSDNSIGKLETDCAVDTPSRVSDNAIGKTETDSVASSMSRGSSSAIGKTETDSVARGSNSAIGKLEPDSVAVLPPGAYHARYPSDSVGYGKDFDDVESACDLKNECINYAILKLVEVMKDEIVTRDVFYLTEDAGGDYGLKVSPSLEVNVSMVTDTRDDGVVLNVDMIAAALKQENLISDEVKRRLTSSTYSPHRQAGLVLQLLLFILNLNIAIYPSLTKAFEGLKQRAKQPKDGPQEGGNFNSSKTSPAEDVKPPDGTVATAKNSKDKKTETKPQKTSLKGPEAKLQIISNVLFTMVEGKNYYPYDFEVQLRKFVFESKQDVSKLRNKDGLTLLQAIVTNNRPQFFSPLFRAGCWSDLKSLKADDGPYEGKSAEDICANARFRKVQKEMDTYTTWEKSLNQIHLAARKGDLVEVKKMLKFSQDLHNEPDSMDCTSMYWAVVGGNVDIVKLLVNLKVDHAKVNKRKESILHVACIVGHTHLLTTLVKDLKMDWTVKDAAKKSPLLRVAENGDDKSLAKLMKCGLRKDKLGSVLAIAGHYGRLGFLRKVIEDLGVDPGSKDDAGKSPFMRACEQGKLEVAKYLLTRGVNICETDTRRRNVLHMAADGAGVETVEFLLNEIKSRKGDDVLRSTLCQRDKYIGGELCMLIRGKDKGRDSWHYVEVCRGLMDVFMKRTRSGTIDVAKYGTLLHSGWGVDPDEESAREIEQRFETRRNANMAEDLDVTPLHIAAFKDKDDVAELLMEKGGDVNVRDKFGLTPLHVAAMRGNLAIVKGLLKRGAATDVLDNLVKTPMDVAEDNEHPEVAAFMRSSQYLPVAQNFRERILANIQRVFEEEYIRQLQESGRDVRTHLINTLRDLTIDINESLLALGSGPVLEESTPNDHSTKD